MKFKKGQKVKFVGSIGNYNSTYQKPEYTKGIITNVSEYYVNIVILNNEVFKKGKSYLFVKNEFRTIKIIKPWWKFWGRS